MKDSTKKQYTTAEKNLQKILVGTIILIIGFIIIFFIIISFQNSKKVVIAFYNIPSTTETQLRGEFSNIFSKKNTTYTLDYSTVNSKKPLGEYKISKADILISYTSKELKTLSIKATHPLDEKLFFKMPTNIKNKTLEYNKTLIMPLLIDHFECTFNTDTLKKINIKKTPETLNELFTFIDSFRKQSPSDTILFCPGAQDDILLQFIGSYIEATRGIKSVSLIQDDTFLHEILDEIKVLQEKKILHPSFQTMSTKDLQYFMKENTVPVVFMPLSFHRTIPYEIIKNYTTSYFPSNSIKRTLTAPIIVALNTTKNKKKRFFTNSLLKDFSSEQVQSSLSAATGLAPTDARANTPDKEADDLRFWIAASSTPYDGLDKDLFLTKEEASLFAQKIRNYLK